MGMSTWEFPTQTYFSASGAVSDLFTTARSGRRSVDGMSIELTHTVTEIVAADLEASAAFYRLLGLEVPDLDGPHLEVELPGGGKLAFDTEETISGMHPGWQPSDKAGRVAIAFGVTKPEDVDAVYQRLTEAGHRSALEPFDAPWGQRYATVLDPDGVHVDLFAASN